MLKIAVAQYESAPGDLDANLRRHRDVIAEARKAEADILVFPELSLVGHSAGFEAPRLGRPAGDRLFMDLAEAAGDMMVVFGAIEEGAGAQFYNSAIAVRRGAIAFVHRKINLATYGRLEDGKFFGRGRQMRVFDASPGWPAAILVCADLWNPALVHLAALQGAAILLGPISSAIEAVGEGFDNPAGWAVNTCFHALTYGMPIAIANRVGREGNLTFWGGSRILDPFGKTVALADGAGETILVADLDYDAVRRARFLLPTARDGDLDLLRRETARLCGLNDAFGSRGGYL